MMDQTRTFREPAGSLPEVQNQVLNQKKEVKVKVGNLSKII